jgi:ABC-type glycerol-3-phosphate transport system permease component
MPIISHSDRRTGKGILLVGIMYALLTVGGLTMLYPFLIMLTGSVSNAFDYERHSPLPSFLWSREDRFLRMLATYFPAGLFRGSFSQLRSYFPDWPPNWRTWPQVGEDRDGTCAWARRQLAELADPQRRSQLEAAARDYADFIRDWNLQETVFPFTPARVAAFLQERYGTLSDFNRTWECTIENFHEVPTWEWSLEPIDQPGYLPDLQDPRYRDLLAFRAACRAGRHSPQPAPAKPSASLVRPAALRYLWEEYLAAAPTVVSRVELVPFPVPSEADPALGVLWQQFLKDQFPLRHIEITVTPALESEFQAFAQERFRKLDYLSQLAEHRVRGWTNVAFRPSLAPVPDSQAWEDFSRLRDRLARHAVQSWEELPLSSTLPPLPLSQVWVDFVRLRIPVAQWRIRATLPEKAFQEFALKRHGSVAALNQVYGLRLNRIEELAIPFRAAALVTFANQEWSLTRAGMTEPYRVVIRLFLEQPRAWLNTVILVGLTLLITLTVNPLAAYALSRFSLRHTHKIMIFCLATMAFPVAVSAIPGFLLLRNLGLLNTFAALVLPSAANGMAIFILKGFFDSLPRELYEAATIDGAPEWKIFYYVALPLMKPIIAVNLLNAFLQAYNAWEWALIVCQNARMWTLSVWTLQFYTLFFREQPYLVMAAFVLVSIPVLLAFLACQRIILRGIILPQMK